MVRLQPFLPGAFFLAIKAQADIVPIALVGTFDLLPMNTYHIKCQPLEMRVGAPISTAGLSLRDTEAVSERVRSAIGVLQAAPRNVRRSMGERAGRDPEATLRAGIEMLDPVLNPHGFKFVFEQAGKGSGGQFAFGKYVRGDRILELHFRYRLGLVTYHIGESSLDHESYMRSLGVYGKNSYPDFPTDPLRIRPVLAQDLVRTSQNFLIGDGAQFHQHAAQLKNKPKVFSGLP